MEMQQYRQPSDFANVFRYVAPEGYEWWSDNTNFGNVIWGGKELINIYYLKEKAHEDNIKENLQQ